MRDALALAAVGLTTPRVTVADQIPNGWTADHMKAIGHGDLEGRGGPFKLAIKQVSGRWYLR